MFKVGQEVVCIDAKHSNHLSNGEIYKVVDVCYGGTHLIVNRDGYTGEESTYSLNRFDHFVDANNMADCEILDHPEDYTSPNCKKFDERVK